MKASIAHGIRPSALILGKGSNKPWSETDVLLAKAYQRFLNELCPQCGNPSYLCHTDDNRVQFRAARHECAASAVAEREQERIGKSKQTLYGVKIYGEPYLVDEAKAEGLEFSDFRKPYIKEQLRLRGLNPDGTPIDESTVSGN